MQKFLENLRHEAEANPVQALGVAAALLVGLSKVMEARGNSAGSRAYARQVDAKLRSKL